MEIHVQEKLQHLEESEKRERLDWRDHCNSAMFFELFSHALTYVSHTGGLGYCSTE